MPAPHLPKITICGVHELDDLATAGVSHALSILDPGTPDPAPFRRFGTLTRERMHFHDETAAHEGDNAPQVHNIETILAFGDRLRAHGEVPHLLVHCFMGLSRSTAATAILLAQHVNGREDEVFDRIFQVRPRSWPNARMIALADTMLNRRGALFSALKDHHRRVLTTDPAIVPLLHGWGRSSRPGE